MGLRRLITDLNGKTIPQRIIDRLDNSKEEIEYRGGKLSRIKGGIILKFPSGYERVYTKTGMS